MKLSKVCLMLGGILIFLLVREIAAIATKNDENEPLIGEEERRGAETTINHEQKSETKNKRGLFSTHGGYPERPDAYPSAYDHSAAATFSSPGFGYHHHSAYGGGGGGHFSSFGHSGGGVAYHDPHHQFYDGHETHGSSGIGHHALKGLLIPLAGIALLGAAAALTTNPVLLQLGVVNGGKRRRRRRRDVSSYPDVYPANPHVKPEQQV